jgi:hypothetical protein
MFNYGVLNKLIVSTSVFPSQYNYTNAPYSLPTQKATLNGRRKGTKSGGTPTEEALFRKWRKTKNEK